jgi:polysaccharide pyruvyl transferase WcaK-like protein
MHACIAALSQGIPAVALAYSGKFNGVFGSVGMEAFVVDLRDHTGEEVLKKIVSAFERRHSVQQELTQSMAVVRRSLTDLTNQLWKLDNDGM